MGKISNLIKKLFEKEELKEFPCCDNPSLVNLGSDTTMWGYTDRYECKNCGRYFEDFYPAAMP